MSTNELLERILQEAATGNLFNFSLDRGRVITALVEWGLAIPVAWIGTVAPAAGGGVAIIGFAVPPGFVALLDSSQFDCSLPWSMQHRGFHDTAITGTPTSVDTNFPPRTVYSFPGYWPLRIGGTDEWTNNHPVLAGRGHNTVTMALIRLDVWNMIKAVILDPVIMKLQEEAAKRGKPLT